MRVLLERMDEKQVKAGPSCGRGEYLKNEKGTLKNSNRNMEKQDGKVNYGEGEGQREADERENKLGADPEKRQRAIRCPPIVEKEEEKREKGSHQLPPKRGRARN